MNLPADPAWYAYWAGVICAVGIVIDSAEILYSRREYGSQGILSWDILKLDSRFSLAGRSAWFFRAALDSPGYLILITVQLALALSILGGSTGSILTLSVTGILAIKLLSHLRNAHGGLDGSDQMQVVVFTALTVFYWLPDPGAKTVALWFLAAQAMLSYLAAGLAKLASPVWRSGRAIAGIMSTDNYGNHLLGMWLGRNRHLAAAVCWSVILFECLAPLLVFAGPVPSLLFLGSALLFHLAVGVIMGLNTFVWSFGASYPAVLFLASFFRR